jgi:hypothetical protein
LGRLSLTQPRKRRWGFRKIGSPADTLVINVTKTAKLCGKVTVSHKSKTCSAATCTTGSCKVLAKTKVILIEKPQAKKKWPFKHWDLNGKVNGTSAKIAVKMAGTESVSAVYV